MNIKDWWSLKPYWIKGGIMGIILEIILLFFRHQLFIKPFISNFFQHLLLSSRSTDQIISLTSSSAILSIALSILAILEILIYAFIVGAIIGWALSKLQNKKIVKWILIIVALGIIGIIVLNIFSESKIIPVQPDLSEVMNSMNNNSIVKDGGACIIDNLQTGSKSCLFITEANCNRFPDSVKPIFNPGLLCTAEELKTNCAPSTKTTLVSNDPNIYFTDTCGNLANIYDSARYEDKEYWAKIIPQNESCMSGSKNASLENCGNCNFVLSQSQAINAINSTLKPVYGEYICKPMTY